ncbi:hypothetical protein LPJ56_003902, partial [Coemansia sp. RSA 2599]
MSSTLPARRPRHQRGRRQNARSTGVHPDSVGSSNGTGWLCMPCLPQDIIESTQYEATIVGRATKPRQPCAFTESQAMGLALILAEQYVRAADPFPLSASQMPLEHPEKDMDAKSGDVAEEGKADSEGFVDARWSPKPHT